MWLEAIVNPVMNFTWSKKNMLLHASFVEVAICNAICAHVPNRVLMLLLLIYMHELLCILRLIQSVTVLSMTIGRESELIFVQVVLDVIVFEFLRLKIYHLLIIFHFFHLILVAFYHNSNIIILQMFISNIDEK